MKLNPFWLFVIIFTVIAFVSLIKVGRAEAHAFYAGFCCNEQDCKPIGSDRLRHQSDGMAVQNDDGEWSVVPWNSRGIQTTPMEASEPYHACFYSTGKARCVYLPQAGG